MAYLKYYEDERERHPEMHAAKCTRAEAEVAVYRLVRHFLGRSVSQMPSIEFTSGNRISRGGRSRVLLNVDRLNWLLVAHEFAHCWHARRKEKQRQEVLYGPGSAFDLDARRKKAERILKQRWHGKHHAKLVDRVVAYMETHEWRTGAIAHELALKEVAAKEREKAAACPPPIDARIAHREAQVKRLTTKIKALTTRLKRAQRSLSALQRARTNRA